MTLSHQNLHEGIPINSFHDCSTVWGGMGVLVGMVIVGLGPATLAMFMSMLLSEANVGAKC
jgi:hypothetical protein